MDFAEWIARTYGLPTDAAQREWTEAPYINSNSNGGLYGGYSTTAPSARPASSADLNIDPTLGLNNVATNNAPAPITVSSDVVETSREILISLIRALDVPPEVNTTNEQPVDELEQEIAELESIPESNHDPSLPRTIDDIRVTSEPRSNQIDHIIDCKRAGHKRRMFYLAKTKKENYCWFCCPRTDQDLRLNRLIGDYQYKLRSKKGNKKTRVVKKLRNGTTIMY
jgi:hypothetical protein